MVSGLISSNKNEIITVFVFVVICFCLIIYSIVTTCPYYINSINVFVLTPVGIFDVKRVISYPLLANRRNNFDA